MANVSLKKLDITLGGNAIIRGLDLEVEEGEFLVLLGPSGCGKSTLLHSIAGLTEISGGAIEIGGKDMSRTDPSERGIGMVYQEMLSFPNLTVAGNIFAGRELVRRGRLLEREMRLRTRRLLDQLHLSIDPDARAESLSAAHRQLLQVARALAFDCRILVLDEPTASLTDAETDHLFAVLEKLKKGGTTLLYVSHRLPEVFRLCNRITVLRDGSYVGTFERDQVTPERIVSAMVGRELPPRAAGVASSPGQPVLEIRSLTRRPHFENVTLDVGRGEIVGLFGLVGSGRSELLETIFTPHSAKCVKMMMRSSAANTCSMISSSRWSLPERPASGRSSSCSYAAGWLQICFSAVMAARIWPLRGSAPSGRSAATTS